MLIEIHTFLGFFYDSKPLNSYKLTDFLRSNETQVFIKMVKYQKIENNKEEGGYRTTQTERNNEIT